MQRLSYLMWVDLSYLSGREEACAFLLGLKNKRLYTVSPDEVGYLACLSGREEAGATLLRTELEDGANAGLESKTKTEIIT